MKVHRLKKKFKKFLSRNGINAFKINVLQRLILLPKYLTFTGMTTNVDLKSSVFTFVPFVVNF
jgi:hypothetical protein